MPTKKVVKKKVAKASPNRVIMTVDEIKDENARMHEELELGRKELSDREKDLNNGWTKLAGVERTAVNKTKAAEEAIAKSDAAIKKADSANKEYLRKIKEVDATALRLRQKEKVLDDKIEETIKKNKILEIETKAIQERSDHIAGKMAKIEARDKIQEEKLRELSKEQERLQKAKDELNKVEIQLDKKAKTVKADAASVLRAKKKSDGK